MGTAANSGNGPSEEAGSDGGGSAERAAGQGEPPSESRRGIRFYWATAGAAAIAGAVVTGVVALVGSGGSEPSGPDGQATHAAPSPAPEQPVAGPTTPGPAPSTPSGPPSEGQEPPPTPSSYDVAYTRKELEFPKPKCPKRLEIDLDGARPRVSRDPLEGADGFLCEESIGNDFTPYEARGVRLAKGEDGASGAQCWQAVDDDPKAYAYPLGAGPFCVLTTEGNVVFVEGNLYGTSLVASAWKPSA